MKITIDPELENNLENEYRLNKMYMPNFSYARLVNGIIREYYRKATRIFKKKRK